MSQSLPLLTCSPARAQEFLAHKAATAPIPGINTPREHAAVMFGPPPTTMAALTALASLPGAAAAAEAQAAAGASRLSGEPAVGGISEIELELRRRKPVTDAM